MGTSARAGGALAVVLVAGWTYYVGRVRRNSPEKTARLLESRDATLGSKLINFLQLRRALDGQSALTRQLGEQALNDYSARLAERGFPAAHARAGVASGTGTAR